MAFQHTAARRRLLRSIFTIKFYDTFQHTAARRRLPLGLALFYKVLSVSTHSRAEAAARRAEAIKCNQVVSTHSRAEAAAGFNDDPECGFAVSTHSRAEAAAGMKNNKVFRNGVSTHSRAEAAAYDRLNYLNRCSCFNTQPRGGGCQ